LIFNDHAECGCLFVQKTSSQAEKLFSQRSVNELGKIPLFHEKKSYSLLDVV
jgi:hypothetical protein